MPHRVRAAVGFLVLLYALACAGGGGAPEPPPPVAPPVIGSFTATPSTLEPGAQATLSWSVTGAAAISLDQGIGAVAGNSVSVAPSATTLYTLTATNAGGSAQRSAVVTVLVPPVVLTEFVAAKLILTAGGSTTLTPVFANASSASVDGGIGPVVSGTAYTVTPAATTTYTLTVNGHGGPLTRTVTVTVVPPAVIGSWTASPLAVLAGDSSQLTATYSGGSGFADHGIGPVASGIPISTGAINFTTTFTLTVTNPAGDSTVSVVTVVAGTGPEITGFGAAKPVLTAGGGTTLTPVFTNATRATIEPAVGTVVSGGIYAVAPPVTTTYTLTVQGLGAPVSRTLTVTVVPRASIASFQAAPAAVLAGGSSQLVAVFGGGTATVDHGLGAVASGIPASTGALAASTTYTLTVTNPAGDAQTASTTVTVGSGPGITSFTASSTTLTAGRSATLLPVFVNAASASIDQGLGPVESGGAYLVTPLATTTYTLTVDGIGGPVSQAITLTVVPAASIASFASSSPAVVAGTPTSLTAVFAGGAGSVDHGLGPVTSGVPVTTGNLDSATTYTLTVTNAAGDSATATAAVAVHHLVTFVAGAGGALSGGSSQVVAPGGACTAMTANPAPGFAFANWTGSGFTTTTVNPLIVANVTQNLTITANFIPVHSVSFAAGANGSVTGTTLQSVPHGAGASPVTAVPDAGWGFVNWTGTGGFVTSTANPLSVAGVTADMAITANFGRLPSIGSFWATSATITAGQCAVLNWTAVHYFTTASIDNGGGTLSTPNGTVSPYPATTTTYTLTASNSVGTVSQSVTVTVITKPVIASFTATPAAITLGQAATLAWSVSGSGAAVSLDQGIGTVAGNSVSVSPGATTTYTLTATNAAGSRTATATVTVGTLPPSGFSYTTSPAVYTKGVPIPANAPSSSGGAIAAYSVAPALPSGLGLDPATGVISGTPTQLAPATVHRITGTNTAGSAVFDLTLTVKDQPPSIGYSSGSYTFHTGTPISPQAPSNSGGAVVTWSIAPALPAGLLFSTVNGTLSGTPTVPAAAQGYTVSATNTGGTSTVTPSIQVLPPAPVITVQPYGQILAAGTTATFTVAASGNGPLTFQWSRNGTPIPGATSATLSLPAIGAAEDGAVLAAAVSDGFGNTTLSDSAVLSLFQDLSTWLAAYPAIASAIKWQFRPADLANTYTPPAEADKLAWASWSPSQQADLNQAYLDAVAWYSQGAPAVTMVPGGTGLSDQPTNNYPSIASDTISTMEWVTPAYMWKLYIAHVAFSLMLEASHQVPWSVTDYSDPTLKFLFDSASMGWYLANGNYSLGTYGGAWLPALRTDNRPRTSFADPRWTYHWLKQDGIVGPTRLATVGRTLDWMRQNMTHFFGNDVFGNDWAIWQYRGYSPLSRIVSGTIDANNPSYGSRHWTAGCHGSTGFLNAALRVVNIPVQPIWVCGHELVYFMSEDLYLDHADNPYNSVVRGSSSPSLLLLIDQATWRSRFRDDVTVNILGDTTDPAYPWIGYTAIHFN